MYFAAHYFKMLNHLKKSLWWLKDGFLSSEESWRCHSTNRWQQWYYSDLPLGSILSFGCDTRNQMRKKNAVFTQFYTTLDVYSSTQQGELEGLLNGRKLHHFLTPKTRHSLITLGRKQKWSWCFINRLLFPLKWSWKFNNSNNRWHRMQLLLDFVLGWVLFLFF